MILSLPLYTNATWLLSILGALEGYALGLISYYALQDIKRVELAIKLSSESK